MASVSTNTASSNTQNEAESPHLSSLLDTSPLNIQRRLVRNADTNKQDTSPSFVSLFPDNQPTETENASPSNQLINPRYRAIREEESPARKRFWSYAESADNNTESDQGLISVGQPNTLQTETDSVESRNEGGESPIYQRSDPKNSTRPLRPSRFRKQSCDSNGTPEKSDIGSPQAQRINLFDGVEKRKTKGLGSSAHALLKKVTAPQQKISLTFDAFVDKQKGVETIKSNYPTYKADKRLIFLGQSFKYPTFVIPYKARFRKLWNIFIIFTILYQVFWYPLAATFLYNQDPLTGIQITEWILLGIFCLDLMINMRTTYSNQNNEEIIDYIMIRKNYMKKMDFIIDVITIIPFSEILFYSFYNHDGRHLLYSVSKLIKFLRILKLTKYKESIIFTPILKILRIFICFFLMVHWTSCIWFVVIKAQFYETDDTQTIWFPNNMRMIAEDTDNLFYYYHGMDTPNIYAYTMLSVFMLVVGSDMAPVNQTQVYITVAIGLGGSISLAYVFGSITYIINRSNEGHTEYQQKLEALNKKLRANKVPHNLRVKVLEYFNYTWRKHRILHKLNDFSELSIPLQRDLAFFQNQKLVTKVPLFQELEPLEVLSIIQKLKTCVYMPGDKIIREGERGTEMYFIQEGIVEIVIKIANQNATQADGPTFHKIYLEKESYFGEIALMSNSKRTSDANAYEFCILESFSRADYNNLKKEFPDIGPRLKSGLKYYKNNRREKIMGILKVLPIFEGLTEEELKLIIDDYIEEVFVDPDKIILKPKDKMNALYFVFLGHINCYSDHPDTKEYLTQLKKAGQGDKQPVVGAEEDDELECLDDKILDIEKDQTSIEDKKKKLKLIKVYPYGGYFGGLDFGENEVSCEHFYVSDSGCQLGAITQDLLEDLQEDNPTLYEKLKDNVIRYSPKRTMVSIEEEAESVASMSMRHSRLRANSKHIRPSIAVNKLEVPKLAQSMMNNASLSHVEEEISNVKEQLGKTQGDVESIKSLLTDINGKLNFIITQNTQKTETSPSPSMRHRNLYVKSSVSSQLSEQARRLEFESFPDIKETIEEIEKSP